MIGSALHISMEIPTSTTWSHSMTSKHSTGCGYDGPRACCRVPQSVDSMGAAQIEI